MKKVMCFLLCVVILLGMVSCIRVNNPISPTFPTLTDQPVTTVTIPSYTVKDAQPSISPSNSPEQNEFLFTPLKGKITKTYATSTSPLNIIETPSENSLFRGGQIVQGVLGSPDVIAFDKDNAVWMGVSHGVDLFNGVIAYYDDKFQIFDDHNTPLFDGNITYIFVDRSNRKWFGNSSGDVFTYDNKQWEKLPLTPGKPVTGIQEDNDGNIWVARGNIWNYSNGVLKDIGGNIGPANDNRWRNDSLIPTVNNFIIDSENYFLYSSDGKYYKSLGPRGLRYEVVQNSALEVKKAAYDTKTKTVYLGIKDNSNSKQSGIYYLKDNELKVLTTEKSSGLSCFQDVASLTVDSNGNIWAGFVNQTVVAARYNGKEWTTFGQESPIGGGNIKFIMPDQLKRIWFSIEKIHPTVLILEGEKWNSNPFTSLDQDPRLWWKRKNLKELFELQTTQVAMAQVLKNPIDFNAKKISFIGKIRSSFEYADFVELDGTRLRMWPWTQGQLGDLFYNNKDFYQNIMRSEYQEYVGFIEWGAGYGHMNSWPYLFFITEIYPYPLTEQQKLEYQKLYRDYLNQ